MQVFIHSGRYLNFFLPFISLCRKKFESFRTISISVYFNLLSLYLSDHELNKHIDVLSKLYPILVKLLCNVPMEEFCTELDTFDVSLLQDKSYFCNFCVSLQKKLSDQMTEFLSVAVNMSQHPQLSLTTSGYLHLLVIYFCKKCVTEFVDKPDSDINNDITMSE